LPNETGCKMNNKLMLLIFCIICIGVGGIVSADYLPHEQETNLTYSFTDDIATSCTATTLVNPDGTITQINNALTYSSGTFTGFIEGSNFTGDGVYCINHICDDGYGDVCRDVTANGRERPEGITVFFFGLIFLVIVFALTGSLLYNIFKFLELNFTATDLIISVSGYFVVYAFFILEGYYLGNAFINGFTETIVLAIGGLTHILLPIIAFFVSWFKEKTDEAQRRLESCSD